MQFESELTLASVLCLEVETIACYRRNVVSVAQTRCLFAHFIPGRSVAHLRARCAIDQTAHASVHVHQQWGVFACLRDARLALKWSRLLSAALAVQLLHRLKSLRKCMSAKLVAVFLVASLILLYIRSCLYG